MKHKEETFTRFSLSVRLEHLGMIIAFVILALTGLPQKFHSVGWAQAMVAVMGGVEFIRLVHRWAAVLMIVVTVHHLGYAIYVLFRRGLPAWRPLFPSWQDFKDVSQMVLYLVGLRREKPLFDKFSYKEKFDYWAVFWGMIIMAGSGLILWFPTVATRWLPGIVVPMAKTAHSDEALLAILAIVLWHMYNVHFNISIFPFNGSIFTGKISKRQMVEEHPLEYARLTGLHPDVLREHDNPRPTWGAVVMSGLSGLVITLLFGYLLWVGFQSPSPSPQALQRALESIPQEAIALAAPATTPENTTVIKISPANFHQDMTQFEGPATCGQRGCHPDQLSQAAASNHSKAVAVAGPDPWLARLIGTTTPAGDVPPNCLLCHAQEVQPGDTLASARSVQIAGGQTCLRCHTPHPKEDVHASVGIACVGCHTSQEHEIQAAVACGDCHTATPHKDPLLNTKHERLDCRSCHVRRNIQLVADASVPVLRPATDFFSPTIQNSQSSPRYSVWHNKSGWSTLDTDGAIIVPVVPLTVRAPAGLDPVTFARSGQADGTIEDTVVNIIASHGVVKDGARTCDTCHGPAGDFDFASLGYDQAQVENLSAKSVQTE